MVVQPFVTVLVTSTWKLTSVAFGFFGEVRRRKPVLMSPVTGLSVGTSGFKPQAYLSKFGIPSLVAMAPSAVWPLLAVVPKYWSRHD